MQHFHWLDCDLFTAQNLQGYALRVWDGHTGLYTRLQDPSDQTAALEHYRLSYPELVGYVQVQWSLFHNGLLIDTGDYGWISNAAG